MERIAADPGVAEPEEVSLETSYEQMGEIFDCAKKSVEKILEKFKLKKKQLAVELNEVETRAQVVELNEQKLGSMDKKFEEVCKEIEEKNDELSLLKNFLEVHSRQLETKKGRLADVEKSILERSMKLIEKDKQIDCANKLFEEHAIQIRLREAHLNEIQESLKKCSEEFDLKDKELGMLQKKLEEKSKKIDTKEAALVAAQNTLEEICGQVKSKEDDLELLQNSITSCCTILSLKEEKLSQVVWLIKERSKELESEENNLESVKVSNGLKFKEDQLAIVQNDIISKEKELELIAKSLEEHIKELDHKRNDLDFIKESIEEKNHELKIREDQCDAILNVIASKEKELELIESSFDMRLTELKSTEYKLKNEIQLKERELMFIQKSVDEKFGEFNMIEKNLGAMLKKTDEYTQEPLVEEPTFNKCQENLQQGIRVFGNLHESVPLENNSVDSQVRIKSPASDQFDTSADRIYFRSFLNECCLVENEPELLRSPYNPAKLVIDMIGESFLKDKLNDFEDKVWKSHLSYLQYLMRLSVPIDSQVKEEASKLVNRWKGRLTVGSLSGLELFCFLHLLSAYGLVPSFSADDMSRLSEIIFRCKEAPNLCQALGFADRFTDFIQKLVDEQLHVEAVRLICRFQLLNKFQPSQLLKDFLVISKESFSGKARKRKIQGEASVREIAALRAVLGCIKEFNIDFGISVSNLEQRINQLDKGTEVSLLDTTPEAKVHTPEQEKCPTAATAAPRVQEIQQRRKIHHSAPVSNTRQRPLPVVPVLLRGPTLNEQRPTRGMDLRPRETSDNQRHGPY